MQKKKNPSIKEAKSCKTLIWSRNGITAYISNTIKKLRKPCTAEPQLPQDMREWKTADTAGCRQLSVASLGKQRDGEVHPVKQHE